MAAIAVEDAIRILSRDVETVNINYFRYTNPIISHIVMKSYHWMLKTTPEIWEYLYDNEVVKEKSTGLRELIKKIHTRKLRNLINWFQPEVIVCTQAFPCVAMAEYKRLHNSNFRIIGIITDYGVHSYWIDHDVDLYIVPTKEAKGRLCRFGIPEEKVEILAIPVQPKFYIPVNKEEVCTRLGISSSLPTILIMGGSQGMIPMEEVLSYLKKLPLSLNVLIVCGKNEGLYRKLKKIASTQNCRIKVFGYTKMIETLMGISDIIVTKPGGLTVSEALCKGLPIVVVNPLPGQERMNTMFLLSRKVAVKAVDARDVARKVGDLLTNPLELQQLRSNVKKICNEFVTFEIAKRILYPE